MTDPRIKRTRAHVFKVVRDMIVARDGAPLTFSSLALEAQVSRRTLYIYWGTIEDLLADALTEYADEDDLNPNDPIETRMRILLFGLRDAMNDPVMFMTLLALMSTAKNQQEPSKDDKIYEINRSSMAYFRKRIGAISDEDYSRIAGPIIYCELFTQKPASDEFVESLVQLGVSLVGSTEMAVA